VFVVCSLTCALAPSTGWLIAARAAQGVGAALLVPSSLALLNAAYPHRAARRRAFAVWAGVAGIGAGAGPVVGGVLVSMLGWRSVFFLNIPIGLAGLVLVAVVVRSTARTRSGSNPAGQAALMIGLAALTAGLVQAGSTGWRSRVVLASFAVAIAAGIAFMLIRAPVPLLPRGLFASQEFSSGTFVGCCINLGFYGELFVMTLYLQQNRGYSSLLTGIALLPQMAMIVVGSAISGRLLARRGPRQMMLIGLGLGAAGLAALTIAGTHTPYALLVGPFMATVLGMAITMPATTMPATTAVVMDAAPPERAGAGIGDPQRRAPNRRRARRGPAGQPCHEQGRVHHRTARRRAGRRGNISGWFDRHRPGCRATHEPALRIAGKHL
jgi:MFS transporter, DHA2 family, methylenomycin A resistance protein